MKKFLLFFGGVLCAIVSQGQLLLNELYVRPNPQQGRQEFFELINTSNEPADASCYSLVAYFKNSSNQTGMYVINFPSIIVSPGGFLTASSQAPTFQYQNGNATADYSWNDGHIRRYLRSGNSLVENNSGAPFNDVFVQSNGGGNGNNGVYAVFLFKGSAMADAFLGSTPQTSYPGYITDLGQLSVGANNSCGGLVYNFANVNNEDASVYGHVTPEAGTDNGYYRKGISCRSRGNWEKASSPSEHTPGAANPGQGSTAPTDPLEVDMNCVNDTTLSYDILSGGTGAYPILVTIYHDANGSQFLDAGDVQIAQYTETSASAPARQVPHARGQEDFVLVFDGQGGCYDLSIPLNCPAAIVLPVTLQSFNLQRNGSSIALRWSTLTEVNNRGFYVQRMQGNGRWENVTFVASQATGGNSTNVISYSFNDMNSYRGISQYRLYQVDIDGRGRYSDIRSTRGEGTISKLLVFPNPSMGVANLQFANADGARDVQVADMSGRVVKQWRNTGSQSLQVSGLTPGIYTVRVVELRDGSQQTERLVVSGNR